MKQLKVFLSLLLCTALILGMIPGAEAFFQHNSTVGTISEVGIEHLPEKLIYFQNEDSLDVTGGSLWVLSAEKYDTYEDLVTESVPMTEDMVTGFDSSKLGTQTLTVTYAGFSAPYQIAVVPSADTLTGIALTTPPRYLVFEYGHELKVNDGRVTLYYESGDSYEVPLTESMVSGYDPQKVGEQTLTISFCGYTTEYVVTVQPERGDPTILFIELTSLPNKLTYAEASEELDVTGGKLLVHYDPSLDSSPENLALNTIDLDKEWVSGFDNTIPGPQELVVNYCGHTVTFEITVEHVFETTVVEPTCTEQGYTSYVCKVCGYSYNDDYTDALGHDLIDHAAKAPTCTEIGWNAYQTCSRCDYSTYAELPALGHDFGEWTVSTEPTCTEKGIETRTCSRCGETETREADALGHDFGEPTYVWSEDNTTITATAICANDETHVLTETVEPTLNVTLAPTYTTPGTGVLTAVFEDPHFAQQSKEIDLDPLALPCDGSELCPGKVFTDMPKKGNWAHDPIDWAVVHEITEGTTPTTFSPKKTCTRGQVVTFLWRAMGAPEPTVTTHPFTDVKQKAYYYKAMLWAVENGITEGTTSTTFSPNKTCTRGQVVTFLWRAMGAPAPTSTSHPFTDVKQKAYYYKAMLWAVETGITEGTTSTTFSPNTTCNRAQVVTFLYRADLSE